MTYLYIPLLAVAMILLTFGLFVLYIELGEPANDNLRLVVGVIVLVAFVSLCIWSGRSS